jgi:hypothetical protein
VPLAFAGNRVSILREQPDESSNILMRDQIVKLLQAVPFSPFAVDVAEDVAYTIPTPDHVLAGRNVLVIEDDAGLVDLIPYSHIRRISHRAQIAGK